MINFKCPRCEQQLEADSDWIGRATDCPTCGQQFNVPNPKATTAFIPQPGVRSPGVGTPPAPYRPVPPTTYVPPPQKGGGGFWKFLAILILAVAGAFGYGMLRYDESPQQVWQRFLTLVRQYTNSEPVPAPTPTPTPAPTPTPTPVATPTPTPTPEATPTPPPKPDAVAWLISHKPYWPKEVVINQPMEFPAVMDGKVVGAVKVPAGTAIKLGGIEPAAVSAGYNGGIARVAIAQTDLKQRAEEIMAKVEVAEAQAAAKAAADAQAAAEAAAVATPTPAAQTDTDLNTTEDLAVASKASGSGFVHPGLLHSEEDFKRMRTHRGRQPWKSGYERLEANGHSSLNYQPHPLEKVVRGSDRLHTEAQNYNVLFNDVAAAYATALRWRVSGDKHYADKSIEIMNAWASTLKELGGSTDVDLAAGIYGYEFANAAEIMRTYKGWKPEDFERFKKMMMEVFYPINEGFLEHHNGTPDNHYWANWDLCNMASAMAISVLCDNHANYQKIIRYFKHGNGNGAIHNAVNCIHNGGLGQWQESGRDQGHTMMGVGIMGAICEMAWKQGDDLYGYDNNRFLAGCEYIAKYNLGEDVPFKKYSNDKVTETEPGAGSRGNIRPVWELVYAHYVVLKGLSAPYTTKMMEKSRPEGGGGDYGPNSGGYDQLGYGTLTAALDPSEIKRDKPDAFSIFGKPAVKEPAPQASATPAGTEEPPAGQ